MRERIYPKYLTDTFGGTAKTYETSVRKRLKAAEKALREVRWGCAWAPAFGNLMLACKEFDKVVEASRKKNWKRVAGASDVYPE